MKTIFIPSGQPVRTTTLLTALEEAEHEGHVLVEVEFVSPAVAQALGVQARPVVPTIPVRHIAPYETKSGGET